MNKLLAAYNGWGDLIATGYSYDDLLAAAERAGYCEKDIVIARVL